MKIIIYIIYFFYSNFDKKVKVIKDIIKSFIVYRNKRYAHIDLDNIPNASFNIVELLEALLSLEKSLNYIFNYLLNPHWMEENKWEYYKFKEVIINSELDEANEILQNDGPEKNLFQLLKEINS